MKQRLLSALLYLAIAATCTAASAPALSWTSDHNGHIHFYITGCNPAASTVHIIVTRTADGQVQDTGDYVLTNGATDMVESIYAATFSVSVDGVVFDMVAP